MSNVHTIPWCEKYRPTQFQQIIMEPINRTIFENIIETKTFPNLLFYGPPGVGKTTSADNLINTYQVKYYRPNKETIIHLNASDERGIELIRNQINNFVKSNNMFEDGLKFVVLDEVDYMTKNAQQALKNLLQSKHQNVRFCLICNYICKIEESLRNEFICIRFNHLPEKEIYDYLQNIIVEEKIQVSAEMLRTLRQMYKSDIRSMVNYLQLHHKSGIEYFQKNNEELWVQIHYLFQEQNETAIQSFFENIRCKNIDLQQFLKQFFYFITIYDPRTITHEFFNIAECINHSHFHEENIMLHYFTQQLLDFYKKLNVVSVV